jgi:hypothetical protein
MRKSRWGVVAASALVAGALALGGASSVFAQQPTPTGTPAAAPAAPAQPTGTAAAPVTPAQPPTATPAGGGPTPPNRFDGSASVDGRPAPDGAAVTALVGTASCGTGQVNGGQYVVDVASAFTRPGCGRDGGQVSFTIGSARATQTGTFATGAFTALNLTAQTPTPTPAPTTPRPAVTPAPTTPRPAVTPAATTPRPAVTPPPAATTARPAVTVTPQRPSAAPALPRTGASNGESQAPFWMGLAAIALLGTGGFVIARRRR